MLIDAIVMATGNAKVLAKASTEVNTRAIGPTGGQGRNRGVGNYAAKVFGSSTRETNCDCNRSDEPNLLQSILLQNDAEFYTAIDRPDGWVAEKTGATASGGNGNGNVIPHLTNLTAGLEGVPLALLEQRLDDAKANNQALRILRLELKIAEVKGDEPAIKALKARAKELRRDASKAAQARLESKASSIKPEDRELIIREAYLRTFGRKSTSAEAEAAVRYLAELNDGSKGLRDLL